MAFRILLLLSSLLLGSSLSLIFSPLLAHNFPLQLFSKSIPGVTDELIYSKNLDLIDFTFTFLFTFIFFGINLFLLSFLKRKNWISENLISAIFLFSSSLLIFLQTHFVNFSKTQTLILVLLFEAIFLILGRPKRMDLSLVLKDLANSSKTSYFLIFNGFFLGFLLLLLLNNFTQIPLLSIFVFLLTPLILLTLYLATGLKFLLYFPGFLLLLSMFFPTDTTKLLTLGLVTIFGWFILSKTKINLAGDFLLKFVYPSLLIFLFVYNPLFYVGSFDSVEEGFFLGWVQHLRQGDLLYRDVTVYHPPLITWGIHLFSTVTGFSIYSQRLFLHLLQILGIIIIYFFASKILNKTYLKIIVIALILSFTSTMVKNNVEIRVGMGLLSLIPLFNFLSNGKNFYLYLSGFLTVISFLVSIEVGLITLITSCFTLLFLASNKGLSLLNIRSLSLYLGSVFISFLPFLLYLFTTSSLLPFLGQAGFYASSFASGYFNTPIDRSYQLSFFHWHIFDQYIGSNAFFWEATRLIITAFFIYFGVKLLSRRPLEVAEKQLLSLSFFGLILFRTALGRSDWYHLLFVLIIAVILFGKALESLSYKYLALTLIIIFSLFFYFGRVYFNSVFLENQIFKFQTYSRFLESYNKYDFPEGGILVGKETDTKDLNNLVKTVLAKTNAEDTIFVYPWSPEIYFFTNRKNATLIDTPYAFFSEQFQEQMIQDLEKNKPKIVIYNSEMKFGNLTPDSLPKLNKYLLDNYEEEQSFGRNQILVKN